MKTFVLCVGFAVAVCLCGVGFGDEGHHHEDLSLDQLGTVHFPVSCSADSQKAFEKGIALLHSFWYEEAEKTFADIEMREPKCAMAYWGRAMSTWHQLWDQPKPDAVKRGAAELKKAGKAKAPTERERDYIAAARTFFAPKKGDHDARARAYSAAMEKVYQKYPEDHEAAAFYALSLLASEPDNDTTFENRKKAGAILGKLFDAEPNHPGIAHYLIHTYDKPQLAELGLPAARRYAEIAPSAPHAVHMPSHIFARVGDWQASIKSNLGSIAATKKATEMHMGGAGHAYHAMDYLIYAYLQIGQEAAARKVVDEARGMGSMHMGSEDYDMNVFAMSTFPTMVAMELHNWKEAAALPVVEKADGVDRAYILWAKTIGSVRSGDLETGKKDLAEIETIRKDYEARKNKSIAESVGMLYDEASAWVMHGDGKNDEATATLRKVADHEDAVGEEQTSMPAREMLADMLVEMKKPVEALAEYKGDLRFNPKRFDGLYGAAQAAELAGQASQAAEYYAVIVKMCDGSGSARPELARARQAGM